MQLELVRQKLDQVMSDIESIRSEKDPEAFIKVMMDARKFTAQEFEAGELDDFFLSSEFQDYKAFFLTSNEKYLKSIESLEVEKLFSGEKQALDQDHIRRSYLGKEQELSMLDLSRIKSIVIVGAGAFSETALYCHNQTPIEKIIVIDNDPAAVKSGLKLAKCMNLNRFEWVQIDAQAFDYSGADAVYLTGFSHPKSDVLKQINLTSDKEAAVLLESCTHHLQRLFFEDFDIDKRHFKSVAMKTIRHTYCYRTVTLFQQI